MSSPLRQPAAPASGSNGLASIQVLRGIAALSVAVRHSQHEAGTLPGLSFHAWDPIPWSAGVDVFFVISGLVMVYSSQRLFARPGSSRVFMTRRVARIVPLYWASTTLYLAVVLAAPALLNQSYFNSWFIVASYLFVPFRRPDGVIQPVYELGWTLNYEMFFYALFAAAIVLPLRRATATVILSLVLLVLAGCLVQPLSGPFAFWSDPIILEFAMGVALGLAVSRGLKIGLPVRLVLAAAGLGGLMLAPAATDLTPGLTRPLVYGVPAALIVMGTGLGAANHAPEGRFVRWASAVGDASYALYLFHPFVIRFLHVLFVRSGLAVALGPRLGPWSLVAIALPACLGTALLSSHYVEKPVTRWMRRVLGDGPRRPEAAPAEGTPAAVALAVRSRSEPRR
jgi:exopolysaccharide production protein ExoZ